MDIWQTASPETPVASGWVGRWLDTAGDDPLLALNIGEVLPPLAVGAKATAAALSVGKSTSSALTAAVLKGFATPDSADGPAAKRRERPAGRPDRAAGRRRAMHQGRRAGAGLRGVGVRVRHPR
jgi:hypothetical protein